MRKILLALCLLGFVGYAAWSFSDSLTPYVSVEEARSAKGTVQVKGVLSPRASAPHMEGESFVFTLMDEESHEELLVRYAGEKPDQFDEAHHIVAIGKYAEGELAAEKLLIKCPSKYEREKGR